MKQEKETFKQTIQFLIIVIFSLIFFSYTNEIVYEKVDGDIVDCVYPIINLIINSVIMIISILIIEISIIKIRKLPKDKNDYSKALVISNIIMGTTLNLFIIFWPIAQYIIKCQ